MRLKMVSSGFLVVLVVFIAHAHSVKAEAALSGLRRVEVKDILVDQRNDQPVLLLQERKGGKLLPIWIGPAEARAIYMELEEAKPAPADDARLDAQPAEDPPGGSSPGGDYGD